MEAYLDNAATTRVLDSVKDIMVETLCSAYGNPSSMHIKGMEAEAYIKKTKEIISKNLKVEPKEIVFTSGGTESNNLALIGAALGNKRTGNHIITTRIEHPSVHNPLIHLEELGFRISYIEVDRLGRVCIDKLMEAVCQDTIIVSIMYVNNEVGSVQDIEHLSKLVKEKNPKILFHVDAIQAFGKYQIYPKRLGIDLLSISGHKIHGPKGSGLLFIKDRVKVKPIIFGGDQQKGMRSGTENVPAIAGLGQAVLDIYKDHDEKITRLYKIKQSFINKISEIDNIIINGNCDNIRESAPHIISVGFLGIKSEVLLHSLEDKGIFVSAGSACASNHPSLSGTLKAMGVNNDYLDSTIRFSLSIYSTMEEIEYTIEKLKEIVPLLRRYRRI